MAIRDEMRCFFIVDAAVTSQLLIFHEKGGIFAVNKQASLCHLELDKNERNVRTADV